MPLQFKRKRSPYDVGNQGAAKRRQGARGGNFRPARSFPNRKGSRNMPYRGSASSVIFRSPTTLPDRLYVKLVYREQLTWAQASGNLGVQVYRGNSLFDPDLSGTGGQPMGFDQWTGFYASYTVLGSKIEVDSMMNGGTMDSTRHGIVPTLFSTGLGTGDQERVEELPYTKGQSLQFGASGVGQGKVKGYMSTAKIWGVVRPSVQIEDGFSALVTANPADQWFWNVWNYVPGGGTQSMIQNVRITYFVVFEARQMLASS